MLIECNVDAHLPLIKDDPVRPDLFEDDACRFQGPFRVYAEADEVTGDIQAVVCVLLTAFVPSEEEDIRMIQSGDFFLETEEGESVFNLEPTVACPYSIWSYKKGAGSELIRSLLEAISIMHPSIDAVVTMSPKTDSALKFHMKNGAEMFDVNSDTINYAYDVPRAVLH